MSTGSEEGRLSLAAFLFELFAPPRLDPMPDHQAQQKDIFKRSKAFCLFERHPVARRTGQTGK
jgi:hypothetical protein